VAIGYPDGERDENYSEFAIPARSSLVEIRCVLTNLTHPLIHPLIHPMRSPCSILGILGYKLLIGKESPKTSESLLRPSSKEFAPAETDLSRLSGSGFFLTKLVEIPYHQ
jgi:hypothetical protein